MVEEVIILYPVRIKELVMFLSEHYELVFGYETQDKTPLAPEMAQACAQLQSGWKDGHKVPCVGQL